MGMYNCSSKLNYSGTPTIKKRKHSTHTTAKTKNTVTDLTNELPGNSSVNTVQRATID
jgi:hypothetical protein